VSLSKRSGRRNCLRLQKKRSIRLRWRHVATRRLDIGLGNIALDRIVVSATTSWASAGQREVVEALRLDPRPVRARAAISWTNHLDRQPPRERQSRDLSAATPPRSDSRAPSQCSFWSSRQSLTFRSYASRATCSTAVRWPSLVRSAGASGRKKLPLRVIRERGERRIVRCDQLVLMLFDRGRRQDCS
jgi:hypothetical protein